MKENRELPFQFRTWGFEIYDIINIILSVFVIVRLAMENGPVHLYVFRGIEILASIGLIVFIMLIWKNHEEVRERRFFSLSFLIAWVGVIIQAVSAIMIIPQNLFENPLFSEIFFEVAGLIALEAIPTTLFIASKNADKPKTWCEYTLVGVIIIAVVSILCDCVFVMYKNLSALNLEGIIELISFSMPLFLSAFGLIELTRWKKAMPKVLPAEEK